MTLYDNSLFIFTSDHGDSLNEHNSPHGHRWFIYTEQIQVPLIIKFPKNKYIKSVTQINKADKFITVSSNASPGD